MILLLAMAAIVAGMPTEIPIDAAARVALPPASATLMAHGKSHSCSGVRLADLLARAGVPTGEAIKGAALTTVVVADAADGYRVVFSLGELDARLGNATVIVADRCDGAPLAARDGPLRLVVTGDARGARSLRQLVRLATLMLTP